MEIRSGGSSARFLFQRLYFGASSVSWVLQSEKNAIEILDAMENEALESHASVREKRQLKILLVTPLCSFYRTNGFSGCCSILSILDFSFSLFDVC